MSENLVHRMLQTQEEPGEEKLPNIPDFQETLDVITKLVPVAIGTSFSQTLSSFASACLLDKDLSNNK